MMTFFLLGHKRSLKKTFPFLFIVINLFQGVYAQTDDEIIEELFYNSYLVYKKLRHANGLYYNSLDLNGVLDNRGANAVTGFGLTGLCVAHAMGWEPNAETLALETLQSVNGNNSAYPSVKLATNAKGVTEHFYVITTGEDIWLNTESYSPIDHDLLVAGVIFAKNYFNTNAALVQEADILINALNQEDFFGDISSGQVALGMKTDGTPNGNYTKPYSEYMLINYIAKELNVSAASTQFWNLHYATTSNLQKRSYGGYNLLTTNTGGFLSSFIHSFNFITIHDFSNSSEYLSFMENAAYADISWWSDQTSISPESYEWGTGAGTTFNDTDYGSYHADKIRPNGSDLQNKQLIVSPHIIAGFAPVIPDRAKADLIAIWKHVPKARFNIGDGKEVLWRYSFKYPNWDATRISGVDFASMYLGLASLPQFLGLEFFNTYNDFNHYNSLSINTIENSYKHFSFKMFPNPLKGNQFNLSIRNHVGPTQVDIYDTLGKKIYSQAIDSNTLTINTYSLSPNVYYIKLMNQGHILTKKLVIQ
ncbi:T9SS type A sorting domain-containing protein [Tamlana sp. 2201CG12-4]|uniref:T9SS type A sorting domain-containing protein n=1 Tax=Tamlana sp. 2201CG12-4 TaxID=3112582 RepID=UPI002DBF6BBB|nr:T9SS type A sorting domain-containing protein [Tamlana sp. 2201CG12-4]MEC3908763.1 T9SS type A sorting domain-containing protein [Tamlana sp. 2201CG12-4]